MVATVPCGTDGRHLDIPAYPLIGGLCILWTTLKDYIVRRVMIDTNYLLTTYVEHLLIVHGYKYDATS